MAAKENKIPLKLMVHKEKRKVVFAEADNNFVETLFSIMTLPMATIVRLFDKCPDQDLQALGSLKNLYRSLEELPECYFSNEESKFMMLHPRTSAYKLCRELKVKIEDPEPLEYFLCDKHRLYFGTSRFARCPDCGKLMNREVQNYEHFSEFFDDCDDPDGFLPSLATFIVTDDFNVMPNSLDFSVRLLCDLGFTDSSHELEEMTFDIGTEQMVILVKAALLFKNPLTYLVFHSIHPSGVLVNSKPATSIQHVITNKKSTNSKTMALRVALQKSTSKFLFAEAEEDFVDFIFGFLEIPLGTLIGKLMNGNTSFECLDNLFASISNMSVGRWIESQYHKDLLIKPEIELKYVSINQIFPLDVSKCFGVSLVWGNMELDDPRVEGRFLKPPTKFMLTDDLVITPLSSISGISMLNKLKVPLNDVEYHAVTVGIEEKNKVAFAEADNTFVDTLFSIMTFPMATVVRLFDKCPDQDLQVLGSLKNLYQSLEELPECYFSNEESKFMMLNPTTSAYHLCRKLKLNVDDSEPTKYFICETDDCRRKVDPYFSTSSFARCRYCRKLMDEEIGYKSSLFYFSDDARFQRDDPGVFVSSLTTFIVTDDLCVMPNSLDSSVRLLRDLGFTDASQLEEKTLDIGREQMVILLKAAIFTNYPLTYLVFHSIPPSESLVNPKHGSLIQHLTGNEKDTELTTMVLKLTLQKSTSKFLFAEANQDFVDFLFGFMEIPLGTLVGKLMNGSTSIDCFNNLFASISNTSVGECIKSEDLKDLLIQPQLVLKYVSENQIFPLNASKSFESTSSQWLRRKLRDPRDNGRFLKATTKFMLTDDLVITPLSSIFGISMLNKLKVPIDDVEQHAVIIDIEKRSRCWREKSMKMEVSMKMEADADKSLKMELQWRWKS
ncbi:hypothetical protein OSB04_014922 [Centaurea solstitialis]|uniref:Uncharacterized protein n=1 Tax=Centaurea solstitialis TaxID=347529 RepID=A0AA38W8F9_9ASTR|nr:hypothetical protein OSB04_014922 [Centaurea solstitialis]